MGISSLRFIFSYIVNSRLAGATGGLPIPSSLDLFLFLFLFFSVLPLLTYCIFSNSPAGLHSALQVDSPKTTLVL